MHQPAHLAVKASPGPAREREGAKRSSRGVSIACLLSCVPVQGIADEMKGKVSVVKIDTDKYPNLASRYGIKVCTHV
jgi:hypothetical protein